MLRTMTLTAILMVACVSSTLSQSKDQVTELQAVLPPVKRIVMDSLVGPAINTSNSVVLSLSASPLPAYCGRHCASRTILKVRLSTSGVADQLLEVRA